MRNFKTSFKEAQNDLIRNIITTPDFVTRHTNEKFDEGFTLVNIHNNRNDHSNYDYAEEFFQWMMTGEKQLSDKLLAHNPWVKRFVDQTGLPETFSASYGWKIKKQMDTILQELKDHSESRRAYFNILYPDDQLLLNVKSTHEYPCTVGMQLMVRNYRLHMIVNMRSNNVVSVLPYDVYNFTRFQAHLAGLLNVGDGFYCHQMNNAHIYKGDVRRFSNQLK